MRVRSDAAALELAISAAQHELKRMWQLRLRAESLQRTALIVAVGAGAVIFVLVGFFVFILAHDGVLEVFNASPAQFIGTMTAILVAVLLDVYTLYRRDRAVVLAKVIDDEMEGLRDAIAKAMHVADASMAQGSDL